MLVSAARVCTFCNSRGTVESVPQMCGHCALVLAIEVAHTVPSEFLPAWMDASKLMTLLAKAGPSLLYLVALQPAEGLGEIIAGQCSFCGLSGPGAGVHHFVGKGRVTCSRCLVHAAKRINEHYAPKL